MITTNLVEFKTRQNELLKEAENYRLVRSFEQNNSSVSRFVSSIGRVFIQLLSHK